MEQLLSQPSWADSMNLWFDHRDLNGWLGRDPAIPWQTLWIEHDCPVEAQSVARCFRFSKLKPTAAGAWMTARPVDRYVCVRQLPSGPIRKLSEWDQLNIGRSILWHPEPDDSEVERAVGRVNYLKDKGRGAFALAMPHNGSLWVQRTG